ncbi:MAG: HAD domain-containing protein [Faecalitalea cylindroides]
MNPILFLDIDGVLNPPICPQYELDFALNDKLAAKLNNPSIKKLNIYFVNQVYYGFDKKSCELIKKLAQEFEAKIVLTSSWRLYYTKEEIEGMFEIVGIKDTFIDFTVHGNPRNNVIMEYVHTHNVKRYLVIDDFDMRNNFGYRFIQTAQCFNEANYHQARYALKLQESL